MNLYVLKAVSRELSKEPQELRESIFGVLERLGYGENIPMPLCRPLFSIARGLYELRFSHREYRVFYYIKLKEAIYVIHAMRKKTQKIEGRIIALLLDRIRGL